MERFKQLQKEKEKGSVIQESATPKPSIAKTGMEPKAKPSSSGNFAFSLKQKPKLVAAPVKLDEDEDEDEKEAGSALGYQSTKRQKVEHFDTSKRSSNQVAVGPLQELLPQVILQ